MTTAPDGLRRFWEKRERTIVGLHSGTSTDGCTAVVATVSGSERETKISAARCETYEFPTRLRDAVLRLTDRSTAYIDQLAQTDIAVGEFFAESAKRTVDAAGLDMQDVDLIVSSGQVCYQVAEGQRPEHVWIDGTEIRSMLDLGDGAAIARRTGVCTVSTLRRSDNAAGGFGVPLVPFGDWIMFRDEREHRVVWNIGGIHNPTIIPAGSEVEDVWAFDAGPGNMLIDGVVASLTDGREPVDWNGRMARSGQVDTVLLDDIVQHDTFWAQTPPKVAARMIYGREVVDRIVHSARARNVTDEDIVATVTSFTAWTMARALELFIRPQIGVDRIIVGGGGTRNPTLMEMVGDAIPDLPIQATDAFGVPAEAREVMAIVLAGNQTMHGLAGNVPRATGAQGPAVMGAIHLPPREWRMR